MDEPELKTFDDLLGDKMDSAAKTFWWEILGGPLKCDSCGELIERDEPRFGFDKSSGGARLFAKCRCGARLVYRMGPG